jgi:hypothetical protein
VRCRLIDGEWESMLTRRTWMLGLTVLFLVASAIAGAALIDRDEAAGPQGVDVVTEVVARNAAALASIGLPPGWESLPREETSEPVQVLVVGTAPRPDGEPIGGCDPSATLGTGDAFVSIYEYLPEARLNAPDHESVYDTTQFISRPADFATVAPVGPSNCPDVEANDHVADFAFIETGRLFVARVVTAADLDDARYREALRVLNGLEIAAPPEVTTTTDAKATPSTAVTVDEHGLAKQSITDALRGAFGGGGPVSNDAAIAGGFPLGEAAKAAARVGNESFIGVIVPRVNWLTLDSPTHATVNFDLLIDGQVITANTTGEALRGDDAWTITAETFCVVVRRGGVTCPAR